MQIRITAGISEPCVAQRGSSGATSALPAGQSASIFSDPRFDLLLLRRAVQACFRSFSSCYPLFFFLQHLRSRVAKTWPETSSVSGSPARRCWSGWWLGHASWRNTCAGPLFFVTRLAGSPFFFFSLFVWHVLPRSAHLVFRPRTGSVSLSHTCSFWPLFLVCRSVLSCVCVVTCGSVLRCLDGGHCCVLCDRVCCFERCFFL